MTSVFRFAIVALVIATAILAATGLSGPVRLPLPQFQAEPAGLGKLWSVDKERIISVAPGSDAQKAGLSVGDIVDDSATPPRVFFERNYGRVGSTISLPVVRGGTLRTVSFVSKDPAPLVDRGWVGLIFVLIALSAGLLVGLRRADRGAGRLLSLVLVDTALTMVLSWNVYATREPIIAFACYVVNQYLGYAFLTYGLLVLAAAFPKVSTNFRTTLRRAALPLTILGFSIAALGDATNYVLGIPLSGITINHVGLFSFCSQLINNIVISALIIAACLDGLAHVNAELRAQMNWVAAALILSQVPFILFTGIFLVAPAIMISSPLVAVFLDFDLASVPLLIILPYVILRHRLVDLSIVVSRATIFAIVSGIVVCAFMAAEWLAGNVASHFVPGNAKDVASQALLLAVALALGLSVKSIHSQVDRRLNTVFFAKRARMLANLRRFSHETDVVVKGQALLKLFYETVVSNSEASYVAIYLRDGGTFVLSHGSKDDLPQGLDEDDPAVVRLRRWNESFEYERGSHPFSEALMIPMSIHGTLFGILVCGPKQERTHFAGEEVDVLAQAAHRTGIAHLFVTNQGLSGQPLIAPTAL